MYTARARPNLLKVMFEILAIDRKVFNPPVKLLQNIRVWSKLLMDYIWTNPQGLDLRMFAFVFMGLIAFQNYVTNAEVIIPCRILIKPYIDMVLLECEFFFFFHPTFLKLMERIHPTLYYMARLGLEFLGKMKCKQVYIWQKDCLFSIN